MSARDSKDKKDGFYARFGKRLVDLTFSIPMFVALIPVFFVVALLIKLDSPGKVIFAQERVGRSGKPFKLYKFRTMVKNASQIGPPVTSACDLRITRIGRILRRFKIDELPQIVNVIKGDMSLVGPRPEVEKYVKTYWEDYKEILKIRPGLTDYATIVFRNEEKILSKFGNVEEGYLREVLPQKIRLYKKYMMEMSLKTDLRVLLKTLREILK